MRVKAGQEARVQGRLDAWINGACPGRDGFGFGLALGAGDRPGTREVTQRMVGWGVLSGVVAGAALAGASPHLGVLFTGDDRVRELLVPVLLELLLRQKPQS